MRLLVLLLGLAVTTARADSAPLKFQRYGLEQGLSQSVVNQIEQDAQGFLWFATQDGLNRFDGYRFRVFRNRSGDAASLSSNYVAALLSDRRGRFWVGTELGLDRWQGDGVFLHEALGEGTRRVSALLEDRDGVLWVGASDGLYRREADGRYTRLAFDAHRADSLSDNRVNVLVEDGLGSLWVGTEDGLNRLDRASGKVLRFHREAGNPASLSDNRILALHLAPSGQLWIGTGNGLNRYKPGSRDFIRYFAEAGGAGLPDNRVQALGSDQAGRLWIGTERGLALYLPDQDRFLANRALGGDPASLPGEDIVSFRFDRAGLLWIGTYGTGLAVWNPASERFAHYLSGQDATLPPGANHVQGLAVDRLGRIWAGTAGVGVVMLERGRGRTRQFRHSAQDPSSLAYEQVPAILEDRHGRLWFATHGGGVDMLEPGGREFRHHRKREGDEQSLSDDRVLSLHEDRLGRLWVGTESGLDRHSGEPDRFERYGSRFPASYRNVDPRVGTLLDTGDGSLWVGGEGGLLRLRPGAEAFTHYRPEPADADSLSHGTVLSLHEDALEQLWVGTAAGLNRLQLGAEGVSIRRIGEQDGLPNGVIYAILGDGEGRLWLSTNQGLVRYDPETGRFDRFSVRDGLQGNEFYAMSRAVAPDGELFFGGVNGLTGFYPERIETNRHVPRILFSELREYHAAGNLHRDIAGRDVVSVAYGARLLSLSFAADDFVEPASNRFQYRMSGLNEDWVQLEDRHELFFTDLGPGEYRLQIKAANSDGYWIEKPGVLTLRIATPWWRSPWAYLGYGLAAALSLLGAVGFWHAHHERRQRARKMQAAALGKNLEAQEQDRRGLMQHVISLEHHLQERIDENQALTQQLYALSLLDSLTELHNRRYVMLNRARLWGGELVRGHALLLLDIDGFVQLNRGHSHAVGDRVLTQVASLLKNLCPEPATLARWGGDEFMLILPNAGIEASERLAEQLRIGMATHAFLLAGEDRGYLSCSIGGCCHAFLPGEPESGFEQAVGLAERAMHAAKASSRNAWILVGPGREAPARALVGEFAMAEILERGWVRISSSLPKGQGIRWWPN